MDAHRLNLILQFLPPKQHDTARARIEEAEKQGFRDIQLLRLFGQKTLSHVDDLIGTGSDDEPDAIPRFP